MIPLRGGGGSMSIPNDGDGTRDKVDRFSGTFMVIALPILMVIGLVLCLTGVLR